MSLTVLFDLDDTLLSNEINTFLGGYLKALSLALPEFPAKQMTGQLLAATQKMVEKTLPARTLEEEFSQYFYAPLGTTREALAERLDAFYTQEFPHLHYLTSPRPAAVELVKAAFQRGWQLVVATNPLFPRKAILHRLAWAQLPVDQYPFALITCFEDFHFAKPNPAFFGEVLARLGWPEQTAVVVGNSLDDDILPAARLGLPGFYLTDTPIPAENLGHPLSAQGGLSDVLPWLDKMAAAAPEETAYTKYRDMVTLLTTPAVLDTLSRNMPADLWKKSPAPGEWSITEIFCHLRDVDREVYCPRIQRIIQEDNPFLPGLDTDAWAQERNYAAQDGYAALQTFIENRDCVLTKLKNLNENDWLRTARHAIFGPTTLQEQVSFTAIHDRTHVRQVLETLQILAK